MIRLLALAFCSLCITPAFAQHEVMYHISVRSFFDSNGDGHGDLKGIQQKLDYLQQFGVNTISLSPVYQSDFYNNLYATDVEKIDGEYGAFKEYRDLIQNIHKRRMKLYQEVDLQYVGAKHLWFSDSFKNTKSAYSGYIYYTDVKNEKAYLLPDITTYNGAKEQVVAVNLKNAKVKEYYNKVLKYWADPSGDGSFDDGVDGFRFVEVKDKLDNSGKTGNQLKDFYAPLFANLKKVNPKLQLLVEPADNAYGTEIYTKINADRVLASKFREAILSFDKTEITEAADSTFLHLAKDKVAVTYIEDENTDRAVSFPGMNIGKLRVVSGLSFLMGGVPCMYYGQELGMKGLHLKTGTDGDNIPSNEAFEWYAAEGGQGMALWYKDSGAWWDNRNAKPTDGISLEEQQKDTNSLWSYYKEMVRLRKLHPALALGTYEQVPNSNDMVVSFTRTYAEEKVLVIINLSDEEQYTRLQDDNLLKLGRMKLAFGTPNVAFVPGARGLNLTPYCVQVWRFLP